MMTMASAEARKLQQMLLIHAIMSITVYSSHSRIPRHRISAGRTKENHYRKMR